MKYKYSIDDIVTNGRTTGKIIERGVLTGKHDRVIPAVKILWADKTKSWEPESELRYAFRSG